jgi:hypothetical protein
MYDDDELWNPRPFFKRLPKAKEVPIRTYGGITQEKGEGKQGLSREYQAFTL